MDWIAPRLGSASTEVDLFGAQGSPVAPRSSRCRCHAFVASRRAERARGQQLSVVGIAESCEKSHDAPLGRRGSLVRIQSPRPLFRSVGHI